MRREGLGWNLPGAEMASVSSPPSSTILSPSFLEVSVGTSRSPSADAGGWGAEGGAPESAGWDPGYDVGCPRVRRLLLCRVEDGEAAATITGPVMRQAASHPGLEVGDRGERAASSENHVFPLWDQSPPSPETQKKTYPIPQFYTAPGLQPKFKEGRRGYLPKLDPVGNRHLGSETLEGWNLEDWKGS